VSELLEEEAGEILVDEAMLAEDTKQAIKDGRRLVRTFHSQLSQAGDGRTIEARILPYGEAAVVGDPPWAPKEIYRELFMRGAFDNQTRAANRLKVWMSFEHDQGLRGIVGHGLSLEDREDALYGTFRIHENQDGDKALSLVREGLLTGVSIEFEPVRSARRNGIVERLKAHLDTVSLVREGAYESARVLSVRSKPVMIDEHDLPQPFDPVLATKLARFVPIPDQLKPIPNEEQQEQKEDQQTD
jgi:HK97 family phage prohead protease